MLFFSKLYSTSCNFLTPWGSYFSVLILWSTCCTVQIPYDQRYSILIPLSKCCTVLMSWSKWCLLSSNPVKQVCTVLIPWSKCYAMQQMLFCLNPVEHMLYWSTVIEETDVLFWPRGASVVRFSSRGASFLFFWVQQGGKLLPNKVSKIVLWCPLLSVQDCMVLVL
jgi:hypothetical protein